MNWAKWKRCATASPSCTRANCEWKGASAICSNNINAILNTSSSTLLDTNRNPSANNVLAIAGVVIKEMYRRKDFYVLLALVVVITLLMASISFFHEEGIVRVLKES